MAVQNEIGIIIALQLLIQINPIYNTTHPKSVIFVTIQSVIKETDLVRYVKCIVIRSQTNVRLLLTVRPVQRILAHKQKEYMYARQSNDPPNERIYFRSLNIPKLFHRIFYLAFIGFYVYEENECIVLLDFLHC